MNNLSSGHVQRIDTTVPVASYGILQKPNITVQIYMASFNLIHPWIVSGMILVSWTQIRLETICLCLKLCGYMHF
jgi:hypothetical protein